MGTQITIDRAGRLVIPKALRDKLLLTEGSTLTIEEDDGRIVLTPGRAEPRVDERNGFLVIHLDGTEVPGFNARDERLSELLAYAVKR